MTVEEIVKELKALKFSADEGHISQAQFAQTCARHMLAILDALTERNREIERLRSALEGSAG